MKKLMYFAELFFVYQLEIVGGPGGGGWVLCVGCIASYISGLGVIYVQVSIFFTIKNCFCEHLVNVYKYKVSIF